MHIGLIGGIGPAATEFYYRGLIKLYAAAGRRLSLTLAHADLRELAGNMEAGNAHAQAVSFAGYVDQLKAGGCEAVALTSMGGHFCIEALEALSNLPIISAIPALNAHLASTGARRVGVLGTKTVMQSKLYGISAVEVVAPLGEDFLSAHANYVAIASSGTATEAQKRFFESAAGKLHREQGAEIVVLGGTDLFLAFDDRDYGYPIVDSAWVHAEAIARVGMADSMA
ncbi:MAG: aspartate/glutamate racemase family protein [Pararobbsia sp.]